MSDGSEDAAAEMAAWLAQDPAAAAYIAHLDAESPELGRDLRVDTEAALKRVKAALGRSSLRNRRRR